MKTNNIKIEEVPHEVDDHFFDFVGNEFKDHVKGLAEWLKNSADAYFRKGTPSDEHYVVFRFTDEGVKNPSIECIDFVGMDKSNIDKAKRWGDPTTSKLGKDVQTYGGHGNGGKFYMRQGFSEARFITYKNSLLNVFGFNESGKYGYAEGLQDKKITPEEALKYADIDSIPVPESIKNKILGNETGFTVIRGINPFGIKKKFRLSKEMERLKDFPQSRRILLQVNASVIYNGKSFYGLLKPEELQPLEKFEKIRTISVPQIIENKYSKSKVELANEKYPQGKLILKTSNEPLTKGTKLGELNRIDILGGIGVIASYQLWEMGVKAWPHANFIYGECQVPILEDEGNDCVSNDRAKLVKNDTSNALIEWIAEEIDKLANEIGILEREKHKANQKDITSKFNDILNKWKDQYMKKIMSELFAGGGASNTGDNPGPVGVEITVPENGFSFKFPEAEIIVNKDSKLTLKVSVPEALPLGTTIFFNSEDSSICVLDSEKYSIKSDYLKAAKNGQEVAFININVIGKKVGEETIISASAGTFSTSMKVKVVEEKEGSSGNAFPQVLLSSYQLDPLGLSADGSLILSERDPIVYQRPQDVEHGIYWINTSSPMASKIYDRFGQESVQFRNFLFERYVDIFVKEAIHELEKRDFENFNADSVDQKIAEVVRRSHQNANEDLDSFLFDESYIA